MKCVCGHTHEDLDHCFCGCTIFTPDEGDDAFAKHKINCGTAWHCPPSAGPQPKDWREVEIDPGGYFLSLR